MISDDPDACLFDGTAGPDCPYRATCGQATDGEACLGMAERQRAWEELPPDVQSRFSTPNPKPQPDL